MFLDPSTHLPIMFPSPIEGTVGDGHEDKGEVGVEYNLHDIGGQDASRY